MDEQCRCGGAAALLCGVVLQGGAPALLCRGAGEEGAGGGGAAGGGHLCEVFETEFFASISKQPLHIDAPDPDVSGSFDLRGTAISRPAGWGRTSCAVRGGVRCGAWGGDRGDGPSS